MAYKQFPTDKYLAELRKEVNIEAMTKPIIQKHNAELRAKVKPTVEELPPTASDNEIRSALTNELSKVLKAPDVPYVIESLSKANDLRSFYRFSKAFLNQIKDIRNLDASFLLDRWSKFKSQMLIESERVNAVPFQGQTAAEYEQAYNRSQTHKKHLVSKIRSQQAEADALNQQIDQRRRNEYKKKAPSSISILNDVSRYSTTHQIDPLLGKHYNPAHQVENMLETMPYGYQTAKFKKKGPGGTSEFTKIPRKGPALNPKGKYLSGGAIIGQTYLARR